MKFVAPPVRTAARTTVCAALILLCFAATVWCDHVSALLPRGVVGFPAGVNYPWALVTANHNPRIILPEVARPGLEIEYADPTLGQPYTWIDGVVATIRGS
jgi:hypothetical protein